MNSHHQSREELLTQLEDQLSFLESSAEAYDEGKTNEAKRMAVAIRILVHDTRNAKSLLGQLDLKSGGFWDSSFPLAHIPEGTPSTSQSALAVTTVSSEGVQYIPHLDDGPPHLQRLIEFEEWWESIVFQDTNGRTLSRRDLILSVADQDGGAHVDPKLNEVYAEVSRKNSLKMFAREGDKIRAIENPERAAVRQITHEILKTLRSGYVKKPRFPASGMVIGGLVGLATSGEMPITIPLPRKLPMKKVGANDLCPHCNSGRKYKRCCMTTKK